MRNSLTASVTKGTVEIDHLVEELAKYRGRARMLIGSFSAASNLTGVMEQVDAITTLLHNNDALALWDYAAAGPHTEIDMNPGSSNGTFFIFPFSFCFSFFLGGTCTVLDFDLFLTPLAKHFNQQTPTMSKMQPPHTVCIYADLVWCFAWSVMCCSTLTG